MILGLSIGAFTLLHVVITLVAIGSGLIVVGGMFASNRLPGTTALFLFTTVLTSVTGFLFPFTASRRRSASASFPACSWRSRCLPITASA
jgi:hypothetical protein